MTANEGPPAPTQGAAVAGLANAARGVSPAMPLDRSASDEPLTGLRHRFADVEFDEIEGQLRVAGKLVVVEPRPLRLLAELLRRVNEVVTKEELFESVWEGRLTVDHVVANAVSKLRAALGAQGAARLQTMPRVGYKLLGPVQRVQTRATQHAFNPGQPVPGREGFHLERPLGEGGRSDVWLARHSKLGQLHVFKFADDGARLSALKREYTLYRVLRQTLGPRDDFAQVMDSNFLAAPYFLECAFAGTSLLEWAEEDAGSGVRLIVMPLPERLALFVQIARAVAAAHSVGVLHKDIKPGNVLVQAVAATAATQAPEWQTRLTDFGSGRLLDPSRLEGLQLTALGLTHGQDALPDSRSGTLLYLAPELLAGQAPTVQSDVYALGLLLYQMVVADLRRPLATGWQRDVDDELLREDISAATEGRPDKRINSAAELVELLQTLAERNLAREQTRAAVQAAKRNAQLLQTSRARRPWVVTAMLSLALGMAGSLAFSYQARTALKAAELQTARADSVNGFLNDDLLSGIGVVGVGPNGTVSMRAVLDRAAARATERFKEQPELESLVRGKLGSLFHLLSMFDRSETEFRRALALASPQALRGDARTLKTRFELISNSAVHNKLPEAKKMLDEAERDFAAFTQDPAHKKSGDRSGSQWALVEDLTMSAAVAKFTVLHSSGQNEAALVAARRVVMLADQAPLSSKPDAWFVSRLFLGDTLYRMGDYKAAEAVLAGAVAPDASGRTASPVSMGRARVILAQVWAALDKNAQAEAEFVSARDAFLALVGPNEHYVNTANAGVASIYDSRGDFERARIAFQATYDGFERAVGKGHPSTRVQALNLAIAELNSGRLASALAALDAGRPWFVQYLGGEKGAVVQAIDFERARALTSLGRAAEATVVLAELDPKVLAAAAPARDWPWRLQADRGRALVGHGRRAEGMHLMQAALQPMQDNGSSPWVLAGYRKLAGGMR